MKPNQTPPRVGYFPSSESSAQSSEHSSFSGYRTPDEEAAAAPKPASSRHRYTSTPAGYPAPQFTPNQHHDAFSSDLPSDDGGQPAPKKQSKRWIILGAFALCIIVFVTCLTLLINYFMGIAASRRTSSHLEQAYVEAQNAAETSTSSPTPTPEPPAVTQVPAAVPEATALPALQNTSVPAVKAASELWPTTYASNPTLRVSSVFYRLQQQNRDIIGWLKIDGVVEEAVVQRDNSYYLTHDALQNRSITGALFLDETCDLTNVPTQMVIHGHNMKEGAMFGSLKKYKVKDASFYRSNPFVDFNTIYENGRYVIFAVSEVDIRAGRADYLPFWHDVRFSSAEAFNDYVKKARALSHYRCNVEVVPGDRLLTLSTCTGNDENKRLLVMARKIRDGENELELQMDILSTSDR